MQILDGKLVLGRKNCTCDKGTSPARVMCPKCKGTRRGPRGGKNKCSCYDGTVCDHSRRVPCKECQGNYVDHFPENDCDQLPLGWFDILNVPVIVTRTGRNNSFNESWLGFGMVYSVMDYGTAWNKPDADIKTDVEKHLREETWMQACKIFDKSGNAPKALVVCLNKNGYSVRASHADIEVTEAAKDQLNTAMDRLGGFLTTAGVM